MASINEHWKTRISHVHLHRHRFVCDSQIFRAMMLSKSCTFSLNRNWLICLVNLWFWSQRWSSLTVFSHVREFHAPFSESFKASAWVRRISSWGAAFIVNSLTYLLFPNSSKQNLCPCMLSNGMQEIRIPYSIVLITVTPRHTNTCGYFTHECPCMDNASR